MPTATPITPRPSAAISFISFGLAIISIVLSFVVSIAAMSSSYDDGNTAVWGYALMGCVVLGYGAGLPFAIASLITGIKGAKKKAPYYGFAITAIVLSGYFLVLHSISLIAATTFAVPS